MTTALVVTLLCAQPAAASDGVVEINDTCAVNGGCFSGDVAGYPVTINGSAGHSYVLTGDLVQPDVNTNAISVNVAEISIDLNGFQISGPVTCSGAGVTLSCSGSGTGSGIGGNSWGMSIRNGSIVGVGRFGVHLGDYSEARNLRVRWSGIKGIAGGEGSSISECAVKQNADHGIEAGDGSVIFRNATTENGGDGINTGEGSVVSGNTTTLNGGDGIDSPGRSVFRANAVKSNTGYAFGGLFDNIAQGNIVFYNTAGTRPSPTATRDMGGNYLFP